MNPKTNSGYDMYDMYDMWENLPFKGDTKRAYEALKTLYQEPHRAYHNLQHIKECLALSGRVREVAAVTEVLTFAIWYHDAIYDPKAKNNEERSADLFAEHAKAFGS
jgi:predicted metal-dependent HD superfamily phosphohydrolase